MSDVKYKNYLEHEIHVRFVDGILEHSQDWQWFIDHIEDNYELSDIETFSEFQNRSNPLISILSHFVNVLEVCNRDFQFENILLQEIYLISKYYVGEIAREKCSDELNTEFCKILFLLVWLTKLQNSGNNSKYIVDNRFLNQRNFHQAINMQAFDFDKEEILSYLEQLNLIGFDKVKQIIEDNLNKRVYDVSEGFFEKYGDNLLSVNCFNYQSFNREDSLTWQENTLLDMLQILIRKGEISPMFSRGDSIVPNYNSWTPDLLEQLKNYFNHHISNFVIESVDFLLNKKVPGLDIVETHCKLLIELINNGDDHEIVSSSTYEILALLNKDEVMRTIEKTEVIKDFYRSIQSITSINLLLKLQTAFPLHKDQRNILKNHI